MKKKTWIFSFLALLLLDAAVKYWTYCSVPRMNLFHSYPYGGIGVFEDFFGISFSLNRLENKGAAWGLFANYSGLLLAIRCVVVLGLFFYALFMNQDAKKNFPFLLILSGATGNIFDFIIYGYVIDLFHFNFWGYTFPIFNLADSFISIGVTLLLLPALFEKRKKTLLRG